MLLYGSNVQNSIIDLHFGRPGSSFLVLITTQFYMLYICIMSMLTYIIWCRNSIHEIHKKYFHTS